MSIEKVISLFFTEKISGLKKGLLRNVISIFPLFFFVFFLFHYSFTIAQDKKTKTDHNPNTGNIKHDSITTGYIIIKEITITGNRTTKEHIILRETGYKTGDTIPAAILQKQLLWVKNRIFNTTLFLWVDITLSGEDLLYKNLSIGVRERFFITPVPSGGLIDLL
jgi:hypothetical protein